jgi:3-(3-hydroxy-phenyl)propionate hydroxylase
MVADLVQMEEPRKYLAGMVSQLDIHYELGEGHKLLGRRMPDLDLETGGGPRRVYSFMHGAQPLLLNFGAPIDIASWADRVQLVEAQYHGPWELPVIGSVPAPSAVLIRPDGYVAWVGEGSETGLIDALDRWFGAAA